MAPDEMLREMFKKLEDKYPDSHIVMNLALTELQDDDILEDIFEEGDIFTAFRTGHNKERAPVLRNNLDSIVVLVDRKRQPMFIKSGTEEKYRWKALDFDPTITLYR